MDDGEEIRALIHSYAEKLDSGDLDGVADLFADATWRSVGSTAVARGADEVRRRYRGVVIHADGTPMTKHVLTNVRVVVADRPSDGGRSPATAVARTSFTVLQATPDHPLGPILAGGYHDEFAKVDDRWRFTDRMIRVDLVGDLGHHMRATDGPREQT